MTNAGYLGLSNVLVTCFVTNLQSAGINMSDSELAGKERHAEELSRQHSLAVPCKLGDSSSSPVLPTEAEIVITVSYNMPAVPGHRFHDYHSFSGKHDEQWEWPEHETPRDVRDKLDKMLADELK